MLIYMHSFRLTNKEKLETSGSEKKVSELRNGGSKCDQRRL